MLGLKEENEELEKRLSQQYKTYYDRMLANFLMDDLLTGEDDRHACYWEECNALEDLRILFITFSEKKKECRDLEEKQAEAWHTLREKKYTITEVKEAIEVLEEDLHAIRYDFMNTPYLKKYRRQCIKKATDKYRDPFQKRYTELQNDIEALKIAIEGKQNILLAYGELLTNISKEQADLIQEMKEEIVEKNSVEVQHELAEPVTPIKKPGIKSLLLFSCGLITLNLTERYMSSCSANLSSIIIACKGLCLLMSAYECGILLQRYFDNNLELSQ